MDNSVMIDSNFLELGEPRRGKVRDIYDLDTHLLLVVTDRVSAFDVILPNGIPEKGRVLTEISNIWFELTEGIIPNHVVSSDVDNFAKYCPQFAMRFALYAHQLRGRSTLVKKVQPLPIEAIVRGYISGSGWESYQKDRTICGIKLSDGLVESDKLPGNLFTPSTKAESGLHDENISFGKSVEMIGLTIASQVRMASLEIYTECSKLALQKGIIIADTKFEFGLDERGKIILIDEVLTPDSSRFWPADRYKPGGTQSSYDKQFLRNWLKTLSWDKTFPGPELPERVIQGTQERYLQVLELIRKLR